MPHNRTRIWVGLAIAAVTIPAVAQYYYGSASHRSSTLTVEATTPINENETALDERLTVRSSDRDYLGEVSSALSKGGSKPLPDETERSAVPIIFSGPIDAIMDQAQPVDRQPIVADDVAPAPARLASRQSPAVDTDDEIAGEDETPAVPGLSDRTVYQLVVDNLPEEDRDNFVQAWAAMTPAERSCLLDEWRANLDNRD